MLRPASTFTKPSSLVRRFHSTYAQSRGLPLVNSIINDFNNVDVKQFREIAFVPEKPLLISLRGAGLASDEASELRPCLPAAEKWFVDADSSDGRVKVLSQEYLQTFGGTILPYEFTVSSRDDLAKNWLREHGAKEGNQALSTIVTQILQNSNGVSFHRFQAPLSLFLEACRSYHPALKMLYIAQAQLADLPEKLQHDLPIPRVVKEAGKGDVYDSNIWMGIPPTYTPLHKDPNPNLLVQLCSSKRVRMFEPALGSAIFREVQQKIGQNTSAAFRGNEMMEGPEREALDQIVWGEKAKSEGLEAVVASGDALFIPKGWWHSIKSVGTGVTVSVNWWFR